MRVLERGEKRVVKYFLRVAAITDNGAEIGEEPPFMTLVEAIERIDLAFANALEEGFVRLHAP